MRSTPSRLAQSHTGGITADGADWIAIGDAFSVIERHAKHAEQKYVKMLDVCYEFLHAGEDVDDADNSDEKAAASIDAKEPPIVSKRQSHRSKHRSRRT